MTRSEDLFEQARQHLPGGVNSPVRAFARVGGQPRFIQRADGPCLYDEDGNSLIDYVGSWGPMIAGHNHPAVREAVAAAINNGLSFGAPTAIEVDMADTLCQMLPSLDKVRMVNSGTEATMTAIRLARGFTGRDTIVKFEGCYHGHADSLLVKAGSGALTLGEPDSLGVPADFAKHTVTLDFNDADQVRDYFARSGDDVACIIVEPVAGNMNCVPPVPGFLETLREVCDQHGTLLIFDEVMTGFRVDLTCAQGLFGIQPDLTTLGKVIGGGMPVGAFGGREDVMSVIAPLGGVYQAGTLSGNPVAMAAGLANLALLRAPGFFERLSSRTSRLLDGLKAAATEAGVPLTTNQVGGMFGFFFTPTPEVRSFSEVMNSDSERFNRFFNGMLERGVYFAPSPFEAGFMSDAHGEAEIDATLAAARAVLAGLA